MRTPSRGRRIVEGCRRLQPLGCKPCPALSTETENRPWLIFKGSLGIAMLDRPHRSALRWRCTSLKHAGNTPKRHYITWFLQGHIINTREQHTDSQNYPSPAFWVCFIYEDGGSEKLNDQNDALTTKPHIFSVLSFLLLPGQAFI